MKSLIIAFIFIFPLSVFAAGGGVPLQHANVDISDKASLQNGAKMFVNYCMGCHSAKFMRYERMGQDLGLTNEQLKANLMFAAEKVGDTMLVGMEKHDAQTWFGVSPPDLSVTARSRGADWIYTFLLSFYLDPNKITGVNNLLFKDTAMPHVLWEMQGWQQAVHKGEHGHETVELELVKKEGVSADQMHATEAEYRRNVRDLVNFLSYVAEPARMERESLGWKVILFLIGFTIVAYLLKKEFWRDVPH